MATITHQRIGGPPGGINMVRVDLTQAEIQNGATPVDVVPAPGVGKVHQILGGYAKLFHNGTSYAVADTIYILVQSVLWQLGSFVNAGTSIQGEFTRINSTAKSEENSPIRVQLDNNATGNGGTISVWIQYVTLDVS